MKVNGMMIKYKDMEYLPVLMVMYMKEIGQMIKYKEKVSLNR